MSIGEYTRDHLNELFSLAVQHHKRGDLENAKLLYKEILEANPAYYPALGNLAILEREFENYNVSKKLLKQTLQINPNYAGAHVCLGSLYQELGELQKAVNHYQQVIKINPNYADAHNNLGSLYQELGELQKAINHYQQAIKINSNHSNSYYNLANSYRKLGELQKAVNHYQQAIKINPNYADAHNNLGSLYQELGELQKAINHYQQAIKINPNYADAYNNLGVLMKKLGDTKQAIKCYQKAIHINPKNKDAYYNLGNTYETLGKTQLAIDCYQRAIHLSDYDLRLNPSDKKAYARQQSSLHLLNSLVGVTTKTAPKCYIKNLFDDFAQTFDHQLANVLDYKIPELLKNALLTQQGKNLLFNMAIDLGCGTGLSGQMFRPICKRLVGIDLSPKMIAKAREKKIYDIIENIEINDYLEQNSEKYDLLIAADVLIYIGDLGRLFSNVAAVSRPGAIFLFSIELVLDGDYVLERSGRYAHSNSYIRQLAISNKFEISRIENIVLRKEKNKDVEGQLFLFRYEGC